MKKNINKSLKSMAITGFCLVQLVPFAQPVLAESTSVDLIKEATQITYQVPENLLFNFMGDGTNVLAEYTIVNETPNASIKIEKLEALGQTVGAKNWNLVDDNTEVKQKVNNTNMQLRTKFDNMTEFDNLSDGTIVNKVLAEGESTTAQFNVTRSAFSDASTELGAVIVTPTVNWNTGENSEDSISIFSHINKGEIDDKVSVKKGGRAVVQFKIPADYIVNEAKTDDKSIDYQIDKSTNIGTLTIDNVNDNTNVYVHTAPKQLPEDCFNFKAETGAITGFNADYLNENPGVCITPILSIPETIKGVPVKRIESESSMQTFWLGSTIKELYLPTTLESIGKYAFRNHEISNIDIPASVKNIEYEAFIKDTYESISPETVIHFAKNSQLTTIGVNSFENNNLREVVIPESVKKIEGGAFSVYYDGSSKKGTLEKVTLPKTLEYLGDGAFSNNIIKEIDLPNKLTYMGGSVFSRNKITKVTLKQLRNEFGYLEDGSRLFEYNQITDIYVDDNIIPEKSDTTFPSWFKNNTGRIISNSNGINVGQISLHVPKEKNELYESNIEKGIYGNDNKIFTEIIIVNK